MKKKLQIETDFIKLEQFIKYSGICVTGGQAKQLVKQNCVSVNGEACAMRGKKLYPGDCVMVEYNDECYEYILEKS